MVIPARYRSAVNNIGFTSISLGYNGVELFPLESLESGQVGYSVHPSGRSLCDGSEGALQEHWLVIGIESLCGDPLILDTNDRDLRVLYGIHGQGKWEPITVALSLDGFLAALRELKRLTVGRENPVSLEANPVGAAEKSEFLARIAEINGTNEAVTQFWELILENET